jgi:hypothetical protein
MKTTHFSFAELGIPPMQIPDCNTIYVMQDGYTRQFYSDSHTKFLAVATQSFPSETDAYSFTRNHGVVDTLTAMIALTYDEKDCPVEERRQFDSFVANELARMIIKGDGK